MPRSYSKPSLPTRRSVHSVGRGYLSNIHKHGDLLGIKMGSYRSRIPDLKSGGVQTVYTKPFKALEEPLASVDEYGHTDAQVNEMDKQAYGIFAPFMQWFRDNFVTKFEGFRVPVTDVMSGLTFLANELFPGVKEFGEGASSGNAGLIIKGLALGLLAEFGPGLFLKAMRQGRLVMIAGRRLFRTAGKLFGQGPRGVWKALVEGVPSKPLRFLSNYFGKKNAARAIQTGWRNSKRGRIASAVAEDLRVGRLRNKLRSGASSLSRKRNVMEALKSRRNGSEYVSFYKKRDYPLPFGSSSYAGDVYY